MTNYDPPTCPDCGKLTYEQFTFNGFVRECRHCGWYDPDP